MSLLRTNDSDEPPCPSEYGLIDARDKTVVDLGAGAGEFSCLAAKQGARRVVAVETCPRHFISLERNIADYDAVSAVRSMVNGTAEGPSPRAALVELVKDQAADDPSAAGEAASLADLFGRFDLDRVDVLKVDCRGPAWLLFEGLEADHFARIGEICGTYDLSTEHPVAHTDDALTWLRQHLEGNGFSVAYEQAHGDPQRGWLYARHARVERAACAFAAPGYNRARRRVSGDDEPTELSSSLDALYEAYWILQRSMETLQRQAGEQLQKIDTRRGQLESHQVTCHRLRRKLEARIQAVRRAEATGLGAGKPPDDRRRQSNGDSEDGLARWRERAERVKRKALKLQRDPAKFFADSKLLNPARVLARLRREADTLQRKARKLRRHPKQFLADSKSLTPLRQLLAGKQP